MKLVAITILAAQGMAIPTAAQAQGQSREVCNKSSQIIVRIDVSGGNCFTGTLRRGQCVNIKPGKQNLCKRLYWKAVTTRGGLADMRLPCDGKVWDILD
jgi:hypothetical protein